MNEEFLIYNEDRGIGRITLNRPGVLNALDVEMLRGLGDLLDRIAGDGAVRALIITGAGERSFSAGADIGFLSGATPIEVREMARLAVGVNRRIETCGKVVAAAINGYALGGGMELAEACALRVAAPHALMGHPEVGIGAIAGWGGTTRLPRLVGRTRAAELLLTGRQVTAREALDIGLINRISADGASLLEETEGLLRKILAQSPLAVRMTWEAIHRGLDLDIDESAMLGADYFGLLASSEDFREGTGAFIEKRAPKYTGR